MLKGRSSEKADDLVYPFVAILEIQFLALLLIYISIFSNLIQPQGFNHHLYVDIMTSFLAPKNYWTHPWGYPISNSKNKLPPLFASP